MLLLLPPSPGLLPGAYQGCVRHPWWPKFVPTGGDKVQLLPVFRGAGAWLLAAWAVAPSEDELKIIIPVAGIILRLSS